MFGLQEFSKESSAKNVRHLNVKSRKLGKKWYSWSAARGNDGVFENRGDPMALLETDSPSVAPTLDVKYWQTRKEAEPPGNM